MDKEIEIPFGAFDSELGGFEYTIPEGYEAEIKDGKVIVKIIESEDEKIKKELIEEQKSKLQFCSEQWSKQEIYDKIAWLEKQGKQKSVNNLLNLWHNKSEKYDGKDTIILYHSTYDDAWHLVSSYIINWNNVDKWILLSDILTIEQKPVELEKEEKTRLMKKCVHRAYQQGYDTGFSMATSEMKHRSEWNEEDKKELDRVIYMMEQLDLTKPWSDCYNFLKSLKDRCLPQPKQEWSEDLEEVAKKEAETVNALGGEFPPNPLDMELIKTIFIHGAKWQKQKTIDKACMYLNEHREGFITDDYIKDFRKALEKDD